MEDLNHLYKRQQTELLYAQRAACRSSRFSHEALAKGYGDRILRLRQSKGAAL